MTSVSPQYNHFYEKSLLTMTIIDPIIGVRTRIANYVGPIPGACRPLLKWITEEEKN